MHTYLVIVRMGCLILTDLCPRRGRRKMKNGNASKAVSRVRINCLSISCSGKVKRTAEKQDENFCINYKLPIHLFKEEDPKSFTLSFISFLSCGGLLMSNMIEISN